MIPYTMNENDRQSNIINLERDSTNVNQGKRIDDSNDQTETELVPLISTYSNNNSTLKSKDATFKEDESKKNSKVNNAHETDKNDQGPISLEEALDKVGVGYFNYKLTIIGGIAILSSYLAVGAMAFILPSAECDLKMTSQEKGRLASASFLGLILSCHLWGFLSDTLGRRYIVLRCLFCDGLIYIITMLVNDNNVMLVLRLLNGIASCGGVVSIYAYIGEFQPNSFRQRSILIASLVAASAYILLPVTAWLTIPATWKFQLYEGLVIRPWRLYYVLCGVPSLFSSILIMFMPESPKFLLAKEENEKVVQVLRRMHYENNGRGSKFTITKIRGDESEKVKTLADNKNKVIAFFTLVWDQTVPLLKRPYVKNLTLVSISLFATLFCNNGIYIWLPDMLNRLEMYKRETGLNDGTYCHIAQYRRNTIITNSNNTQLEMLNTTAAGNTTSCDDKIDTRVYLTFTILGTGQFTNWIFIVLITKYCNKKHFTVIVNVLILLLTISLKISNWFMLFRIKVALTIIFTSAIFPILNAAVVDLFPTNLRAMAGCLTLMASRFGTLSINLISGILIDNRCEELLWLVIIVMAASVITTILLPMQADPVKGKCVNNSDDPLDTSNAA